MRGREAAAVLAAGLLPDRSAPGDMDYTVSSAVLQDAEYVVCPSGYNRFQTRIRRPLSSRLTSPGALLAGIPDGSSVRQKRWARKWFRDSTQPLRFARRRSQTSTATP